MATRLDQISTTNQPIRLDQIPETTNQPIRLDQIGKESPDITEAYKLWSKHYSNMDPKEFANKIGLKESKGIIGSIIENPEEKMPFSPIPAIKLANIHAAAKRMQKGDDAYKERPSFFAGKGVTKEGLTSIRAGGGWVPTNVDVPNWSPELQKEKDKQLIDDFRKDLFTKAITNKGKLAQAAGFVSRMPAWAMELYVTGGLSAIGKKGLEKGAKTALKKKVIPYTAGKVIQGTVGMPHRTVGELMERRIPGMVSDENGNMTFQFSEDSWGKDFIKSWGDTVISVFSEGLGEGITSVLSKGGSKLLSKIPLTKSLIDKLYPLWKKTQPKGTRGKFLKKIFSKGGYSNLVGEIGEERVETALQAITGTQDFGAGPDSNVFERLYSGIKQDLSNLPVEALSLVTPGAVKFVGGHLMSKPAGYLTPQQREEIKHKNLPVPVIEKLSSLVQKAENVRPEMERRRTIERGKRSEEAENIRKELRKDKTIDPIDIEFKSREALAGELPGADLTGIEDKFSPQEVNDMVGSIQDSHTLLPLEKTRLAEAVMNLMLGGKLPGRSDIKMMSGFFGADLGKSLMKHRSTGQKIWAETIDIFNLPRSVLASMDLSGILRQGFFAGIAHPIIGAKAAWTSAKIFTTPEYANTIMDNIKGHKDYLLSKKAGLDVLAGAGKGFGLKDFDEQFASQLAEKLPFVKRSELAYVVGLNKLRFDIFCKIIGDWKSTGSFSLRDAKQLSAFLNHITGRGTINNKTLEKYAPMLNATFFSPRLTMSRFQLVGDLVQALNPKSNKSMAVRKVIAGDLIKSIGAGLTVLGLLAMRKGVKVEADPRSSDFGKIKVGNTRYDYWGGYSQLARVATQMILAQQKSTSTKRKYKVKRLDVLGRFLQTKLSPPVGLAVDLYKGQTFLGDRLDFDHATVMEQAYQRLTPLFMQDTIDAIRYQGLESASITGPAAFFGIGAQTYPEKISQTAARLKDIKAKETFGSNWNDTSAIGQKMLRALNPEITELEIQSKNERENYDFISKIIQEQKDTGMRIQKSMPKKIQEDMEDINFQIAGLSRHIGQNWYLNDAYYKEYETKTKNVLSKVLPKIINIQGYKEMPLIYKREVLDKIISKTKQIIRKEIIDKANYNDLLKMSDIIRK